MSAEEFSLKPIERNSAMWLRLAEHLTARLNTHRAVNDSPKSEIETATLRGRIAELKAILSLGDVPDDGDEE